MVAVAGRLGHAAAGWALLEAGVSVDTPGLRAAVAGHRRPCPPYASGAEAAELGASAMLDVSDGLLQDLGHVARASGVRIELDPAAFTVFTTAEPAAAAAKELGGPIRWSGCCRVARITRWRRCSPPRCRCRSRGRSWAGWPRVLTWWCAGGRSGIAGGITFGDEMSRFT
ncbi:hypothetical protein GCM10020001_027730 [Nonomuraea salmonea]